MALLCLFYGVRDEVEEARRSGLFTEWEQFEFQLS